MEVRQVDLMGIIQSSLRDEGMCVIHPGLESPGYLQMSLRDTRPSCVAAKCQGVPNDRATALSACDDLYDLQPVAGLKLPPGKLRRRNRFAIVFNHHAAR